VLLRSSSPATDHAEDLETTPSGLLVPRSRRQALTFAGMAGLALGLGAVGATTTAATAADVYDLGPSTLYRGMRGTYVTTLQKALNAVAKAGLATDGSFGVGTERAVKAFQSSKRLTADGRVGLATKRAINDAAGASSSGGTSTSTNYYTPNDGHGTAAKGAGQNLRYTGSASALVNGTRLRVFAEGLVKQGIIGSVPRGASLTLSNLVSAVKTFQRRRGITADGIIGPGTWAAMNKVRGTSYPFDMDKYIAATRDSAKGGSATARIRAMVEYFEYYENRSPYTWGGAGWGSHRSAGFDCSGLVYQMVAAGGIVLTSTNPVDHARQSFRSTHAIYNDSRLRTYKLSEMRDGDIITFAGSSSRTTSSIRHDGIYYRGYLLESHSPGVVRTKWSGGNISRSGYTRYVMPYVKRPFV